MNHDQMKKLEFHYENTPIGYEYKEIYLGKLDGTWVAAEHLENKEISMTKKKDNYTYKIYRMPEEYVFVLEKFQDKDS